MSHAVLSPGVQGPAVPDGPVLVAVIGSAPAQSALRYAFAEADDRGVALIAVVTGAPGDDTRVAGLIADLAREYPGVHVTTRIRHDIDAAVTLAAASRGCGLLVTQEPSDAGSAALVGALSHRSRCPVVVARA